MNELYRKVRANRKLFLILICLYISFLACFSFPANIMIKDNIITLFILVYGYFYIPIIFVGLYNKKPIKVFLITLFFTIIGLIARFILEYGEVSNERNFTLFNISFTLVLIPVLVIMVYIVASKLKRD